ncbi:hypothetical protein SynA1840_02182 [Synechococcus sp. A18-40]|nr:hypothetical protein SynA1840_02182 [Synechococcus sp. A18-40]
MIYVEEMGNSPPAADHQLRWIRDGLDATALLYAVQDVAGALVGTMRLNRLSDLRDPITQLTPLPIATLLERFPPAAISHTSRLMLLPAWRGGAALGLLFKRCYGDAAEAGIRVDLCHAKPGLVELYEQLGYRRFCPGLDLEGVGYQVPMLLALHDRTHLRDNRSPLLRFQASRQVEDRWGDGGWMASIAESYRGLNHRLVEPDEFWAAVGDALHEGEQEIPLFRGLNEERSNRAYCSRRARSSAFSHVIAWWARGSRSMSCLWCWRVSRKCGDSMMGIGSTWPCWSGVLYLEKWASSVARVAVPM